MTPLQEANESNHKASEEPIYTTSTTLSPIDMKHDLVIQVSANLTGGHLRDTNRSSQDMHISKSSLVLKLSTLEGSSSPKDEQNMMLKESKTYGKDISETERSGSHKVIHIFENVSKHFLNSGQEPSKGSSEKTSSQPERSPKLITSTGSLSQLVEHSTILESLQVLDNEVTEGQQHIGHPGQEHKENPGEEHEEGPVEDNKKSPSEQHEEGHSKEHIEHPSQNMKKALLRIIKKVLANNMRKVIVRNI